MESVNLQVPGSGTYHPTVAAGMTLHPNAGKRGVCIDKFIWFKDWVHPTGAAGMTHYAGKHPENGLYTPK